MYNKVIVFDKRMVSYYSITGDYIMGTLVVTSLYTNIPNQEGLDSIKQTLAKSRNIQKTPNNEGLLELLKLVLEKNNSNFSGTNYLRISGTAMGTRVAPTCSNLFMSKLETEMLSIQTKNFAEIHR